MTVARTLIGATAGSLVVASLIHFGLLIDGYRYQQAATAEAVIAVVMLVGLALTWASGARAARRAAVGALAFGALGTSVGLFTIAIGVGPRNLADVVYHIALLTVLVAGLLVAMRIPGDLAGTTPSARQKPM